MKNTLGGQLTLSGTSRTVQRIGYGAIAVRRSVHWCQRIKPHKPWVVQLIAEDLI